MARAMRGKAGTAVTLTILRDAEIVTRTIKRAPFVVDPVAATMLPNGVGAAAGAACSPRRRRRC